MNLKVCNSVLELFPRAMSFKCIMRLIDSINVNFISMDVVNYSTNVDLHILGFSFSPLHGWGLLCLLES